MWRFLGERIAMGGLTIFVTTIAVTLLIHLVPGDPVQIMYAQSQGTTPEQIEAIRHNLGLDQPIYVQNLNFVGRLFEGDLGYTIRGQQPVLDVILQRLPNTIILAIAAMAIAILIGLPIGFFAAYKHGTALDTGLMIVAITGVSIPRRRSVRVASSPSSPGMRTSMSTTSGARVLTASTPSAPSLASPMTSMPSAENLLFSAGVTMPPSQGPQFTETTRHPSLRAASYCATLLSTSLAAA